MSITTATGMTSINETNIINATATRPSRREKECLFAEKNTTDLTPTTDLSAGVFRTVFTAAAAAFAIYSDFSDLQFRPPFFRNGGFFVEKT